MAVTYEQFLNALNGSKWKNEWSASDLELAKKHPEARLSWRLSGR